MKQATLFALLALLVCSGVRCAFSYDMGNPIVEDGASVAIQDGERRVCIEEIEAYTDSTFSKVVPEGEDPVIDKGREKLKKYMGKIRAAMNDEAETNRLRIVVCEDHHEQKEGEEKPKLPKRGDVYHMKMAGAYTWLPPTIYARFSVYNGTQLLFHVPLTVRGIVLDKEERYKKLHELGKEVARDIAAEFNKLEEEAKKKKEEEEKKKKEEEGEEEKSEY